MKPELEERALSIVLQLTDLHVNDRHKLQQQLCGNDLQLVNAVDELFRAYEKANGMDFWLGASKALLSFPGADWSQNNDLVPKVQDRVKRPPTLDRFIPIDLLGLGGQGEVWLMKDPHIDRRVALKIVQPTQRDSQATLTSFRREAELNGKLEHPNIVPVYDITAELNESGEPDSKSPCFVMRVFGDPRLHAAISAFHERPRSASEQELLVALRAFDKQQTAETRNELEHQLTKVAFDPDQASDQTLKSAVESILKDDSEAGTLTKASAKLHAGEWSESNFRKLLGRFQRVCEGVAYAHSRGVIHRDLKPDNVMLGEYGETLVADWGLAKIVGRHDPANTENIEGTLRVSSDSTDSEHTRLGELKGTPRFMSPEQAMGRVDELGPATDIYSLGAILYYILTGKPPIEGKTFAEILSRVRDGEFSRPTEVEPRVPKGLEAIVLKAMSLKPRDRYATALDLAGDVEHWLNDERVLAWDEPWLVKGRRWVRRHQTFVTSTAAAMLVGMISLGILAVITSLMNVQLEASNEELNLKKRQLEESNGELNLKKLEAEKNLERANQNERKVSTQLVNSYIARGEQLSERQDLLGATMAFSQAYDAADRLLDLNTSEDYIHRLRIGLTAEMAPKLVGLLFGDSPIRQAEYSPDGRFVALLQPEKGTIKVLNALRGIPLAEPMKHSGTVREFSFSPNGKQLVSRSTNRNRVSILRLWETETGIMIKESQGLGTIQKLAYNNDGSKVVTCSTTGASGLIQFWDSQTLDPIGDSLKIDDPVSSIAFSPDGTLFAVAVGNPDAQVLIYKSDGTLKSKGGDLKTHPPVDICFSPDNTKVGVASNTGVAQVVDCQTGEPLTPLLIHQELSEGRFDDYDRPLGFIQFSPDGSRVVTACGDRTVRLWNATTGRSLGLPMIHDSDDISGCRFSPDGTVIGTSSLDGTARLWDSQSGRLIGAPLWHLGPIVSLRFRPDGKQVLTGSEDRTVRLWTYSQPIPLTPGDIVELQHSAISDDCRWFAGAINKRQFRVWDAATMLPAGVDFQCPHDINLMSFSPGRNFLALAGLAEDKNGRVSIFDFTTGQLAEETFAIDGLPLHVSFSPNGRWCEVLSTTSNGKRITIRDLHLHTQTILKTNEKIEPDQAIWNPAADSQLFVACRDGLIYRTEFPEPKLIATGTGMPGTTIRHLGFSRDGRLLATTSGNAVQVWQTTDGKPIYQALKHESEPNGTAFSADAGKLLTWGNDGRIILWNRDSDQGRWSNVGEFIHARPVKYATLSPDGLLVASASDDGAVRIWDLKRHSPLAVPLIHWTSNGSLAEPQNVSFSPDGLSLFSASLNRPALIQKLTADFIETYFRLDPKGMDSTWLHFESKSLMNVWRWPLTTIDAPPKKAMQMAEFTAARRLEDDDRIHRLQAKDLPDVLEVVEKGFPNGWMARQQIARLAVVSGNLKEAAAHFALAVEQEKSNGQLWSEYAAVLYDLDRVQDAWNAADLAISCGFTTSKVWLVRGRSALYLGRFEEAISDLNFSIEKTLVPCFARLDLANSQAMLGRFDEAAASFDLSFEEHRGIGEPVTPSDRYRRIVLALVRKNEEEFKRLTNEFLDENTKTEDLEANFFGVLAAVQIHDSVEDWSTVLTLAQSVAMRSPDSLESQAIFGYALFRAGKLNEAEQQLKKAIALQKLKSPKNAAATTLPHYFLALTLLAEDKLSAAKESFATANQFFESLKVEPVEIPLFQRLPWQRRSSFETMKKEFQDKTTSAR